MNEIADQQRTPTRTGAAVVSRLDGALGAHSHAQDQISEATARLNEARLLGEVARCAVDLATAVDTAVRSGADTRLVAAYAAGRVPDSEPIPDGDAGRTFTRTFSTPTSSAEIEVRPDRGGYVWGVVIDGDDKGDSVRVHPDPVTAWSAACDWLKARGWDLPADGSAEARRWSIAHGAETAEAVVTIMPSDDLLPVCNWALRIDGVLDEPVIGWDSPTPEQAMASAEEWLLALHWQITECLAEGADVGATPAGSAPSAVFRGQDKRPRTAKTTGKGE